jgi:hypothetical protein
MKTTTILVMALTLAAAPVLAQEKFSLSMFHFNVQYVAGGLQGFPSGEDDNPSFDLDDAQVQDRIIVESFEPVLDVFLAHPTWKVTLEMQAYMAEVMMERHPGVLAKLKQLIASGQAELVSFHYSDQMFLAYPELDLERSHEIMDAVYAEAGITPSPVVFCQEGQFGVGMAPFAKDHGRSILVLPKNLFRYQHLSEYDNHPPLYELDGVDVVLGSKSFATAEVEVNWNFFDDGELLATGGSDPYMGRNFKKIQTALDEYEQMLTTLETQGFRIATIQEYVDWAKQNGLQQDPLPPMLDGTWQPPSTNSMRRWLGGSGLVDMAYACERDNLVLTTNVQTRHWLAVAETLVTEAEAQDLIEAGSFDEVLTACWKDMLLAEVTDATGINPFINEINYGLSHAAAARDCADAVIMQVAPKIGGPFVQIDTGSGEVAEVDDLPSEATTPADPFLSETGGFVVNAPGRTTQVEWAKLLGQDSVHKVTITASEPDNNQRTLEVVFPLDLDGFYLTPGLVEDDAFFHPMTEFEFQEGAISLPVANGLVGLDTDLWLIKQTSTVHIAATFLMDGKVRFIDDTLDPEEGASWTFWIVEGSKQDALELAGRLNLHPVAYVETGVGDRGCGCGGKTGGGIAGLVGLVALAFRARARARVRAR